MLFIFLQQLLCKTFVIKRYGSEEYLTANFDPISLPFLGPEMSAHIFEIAHPENDARISIFKLVCVPRMPVIPDVVLDATKEQDRLTYFGYNGSLGNEEFQVVRYEEAFLLVRGNECLTYNREKEYFYTMVCVPKHPEQLYEMIEQICSLTPQKIALDKFIAQPPLCVTPIEKFHSEYTPLLY